MGIGMKVLCWLVIVIIIVFGLSIFILLYSFFKEWCYELVLMWVMGVFWGRLLVLIILEGLLLVVLGYLLGMVFSYGVMYLLVD